MRWPPISATHFARCGGAHPYTFVNTGGTLGTDAIRVQEIYRTGIVSPVGSPLVDLDPIHNRPPTAQTFDVVDAAKPQHHELRRFPLTVAVALLERNQSYDWLRDAFEDREREILA